MRLKHLTMLFAVLALSLALFACSGDDDDSGGNSDQPTATTEASGDGDGDQPTATTEATSDGDGSGSGAQNPFSSGQATLTIGDEAWQFDGIFCAFSPEEARNDRVSFTLTSFGESSSGARTQLDATIQDTLEQGRYDGNGVIQSVTLNDVEDFVNPSVAWGSVSQLFGSSDIDFQVDGKNVTVDAVFNDDTTDEMETIPGTLTASCP